jgi:pentose-5-phosphate-3-epimerase
MRQSLLVAALEYEEGGQTLWFHAPDGTTLLRLKVDGAITTQTCETSPVAHADGWVKGNLVFCVPENKTHNVGDERTAKAPPTDE